MLDRPASVHLVRHRTLVAVRFLSAATLALSLASCGDGGAGGAAPTSVASPGPFTVRNLTVLWERQPPPDPPNTASRFTPVTLDDRGRVLLTFEVNSSGADVEAGIWDGSAWSKVPSPAGTLLFATSLNNQGWVGGREGFWNESALVALKDAVSSASTVTDLNDAGQAAGCLVSPLEPAVRAMLWTGGAWRQIAQNDGVLYFGKAVQCSVQINTSGTAAVTLSQTGRADTWLWNGAGLSRLASLGGRFTAAVDIDDRGNVVGSSQIASGATRAFLWDGSTLRDLGLPPGMPTLDPASGRPFDSFANGTNERGQIVGHYGRAGGTDFRAFIWASGTMHELTDLIDLSDPSSGKLVIQRALAINESGVILAVCAPLAGGEPFACLLTPSR